MKRGVTRRQVRGVYLDVKEHDDFSSFVHATAPQLHRAAVLLTGDHHLAEDLTQATYAKVFVAWRRVSKADSAIAYARTTLLNTYLSHKRLRRNSEQPVEEVRGGETASGDDPELRMDLLAALGTLSARDRAVVVLRYWEDRSVAEVSVDLGMTETAVRTAARRALLRLQPLVSERTPS